MTKYRATVCNGITGDRIETIKAHAFPNSTLLSAGGDGSVSIPMDGTFTPAQLDDLFEEWKNIVVLEEDDVPIFAGYVIGEPSYSDGSPELRIDLIDFWGMLSRRFAVDHSEPQAVLWSETVTGTRTAHANQILAWAKDSYTGLPAASLPVTPAVDLGGAVITAPYFGYHLNYVDEAYEKLMDQGWDVYFRPRWVSPGVFGWEMLAGDAWSSGVVREFSVTAPVSQVVGFRQRKDGRRVTNNAVRVGEGSEVDMLAISNLDMTSPLPLLERVTLSKDVTSNSQLSIMAGQDLVTYGSATVQWDLDILSDAPVNIGDTLRLHFDGHRRIADGWHLRRVVKIVRDMDHVKTVSVQPTGGA